MLMGTWSKVKKVKRVPIVLTENQKLLLDDDLIYEGDEGELILDFTHVYFLSGDKHKKDLNR